MKRTVLVVDDTATSRSLLRKILEPDYRVLEAENGTEALPLLSSSVEPIALILLELRMPIRDGDVFLQELRREKAAAAIPVMAIISRDDPAAAPASLAAGAADVITKPFERETIRHRVKNILQLGESTQLLSRLQKDPLTGFYNKEFFYQQLTDTLHRHPDQRYDLICSNIEDFKLLNDRHGMEKGDALLSYLAAEYTARKGKNFLSGYFGADKMFLLMPHWEGYQPDVFAKVADEIYRNAPIPYVTVKFAIYQSIDPTLPAAALCHRVLVALDRIRHCYGEVVARYDESLRQTLLREQEILATMQQAIEREEFFLHYQPKYEISTGEILGLEALVRWQHPTLGLLLPNDFIPLFEKNSFVTTLDFYVWRKVLEVLRQWSSHQLPPLPISVNLSSVDFSLPDLAEQLAALCKEYQVDPSLLHLEITESAYIDHPEELQRIVKELRLYGFKIEMDNFGSCYTSLGMLSDLPLDCLKLDRCFVQRECSPQKKNVLSFLLALGRWLEIDTVAEGVETRVQLETLRQMGCRQVQGFYYAPPMPLSEILAYLHTAEENRKNIESEQTKEEMFPHSRQTVLIADDIAVQRENLKAMLTSRYSVIEAKNGQEVLDYLRLHPKEADLILLDLLMPVMDGFRTLTVLKQTSDFAAIPVIMLSERGRQHAVRAISLGAAGILSKPYCRELVQHEVKSAIEHAQLCKQSEALEWQKDALEQEAYRDPMTGCYNRRGLAQALRQLSCQYGHTVMLVDIDNLKRCNDCYGHDYGDELILAVARALRREIRDDDILSRVGGDEFLLVVKNLSEEERILRKAGQLSAAVKALESHRSLEKMDYLPSCSIGAATMDRATDFTLAKKRADEALYQVKGEHKGSISLWQPER